MPCVDEPTPTAYFREGSMLNRVMAFLVLLVLEGCATGAKVESMVAPATAPVQANSALRAAVTVNTVSGGQQTNPLWKSNIGNPEFQEALRQTLRANGMLSDAPADSASTPH
jgi:hypothetical protein